MSSEAQSKQRGRVAAVGPCVFHRARLALTVFQVFQWRVREFVLAITEVLHLGVNDVRRVNNLAPPIIYERLTKILTMCLCNTHPLVAGAAVGMPETYSLESSARTSIVS